MSTRGDVHATARRAVWLGAWGVILAGLFTMHGLDSHGTPGMETTHVLMSGSETTHSGGNKGMSASAAVHGGGSAATETVTAGHPAMDIGMDVTCMAILAVALLALLRRLRLRSRRRVLWMLTRPVRAPAFRGRDPGPPSLMALSIQRC